MDRLDRKILAELQSEGRLSLTDLASRVGLTVSPPIGGSVTSSSPG